MVIDKVQSKQEIHLVLAKTRASSQKDSGPLQQPPSIVFDFFISRQLFQPKHKNGTIHCY